MKVVRVENIILIIMVPKNQKPSIKSQSSLKEDRCLKMVVLSSLKEE